MNYLVVIFSLLIGIGCFWISLKMIRLYLKVKKWSRVDALVNSKEIIIHPKYSTTNTPYGLKVNYTYTLNNQTYEGHDVYLAELAGGQANHMKSDAENKLNKIQEHMPVFVNPQDPAQSVMYCEGIGLYVFVFCMGILSLLIGLGSLV
ncbi:MAG: hypothetical protein K0S53_964 [Bacteroidetes bacterium]|jgi:hypothetical protein|nr:hypothetical protein [Bacteroidota bacterium]